MYYTLIVSLTFSFITLPIFGTAWTGTIGRNSGLRKNFAFIIDNDYQAEFSINRWNGEEKSYSSFRDYGGWTFSNTNQGINHANVGDYDLCWQYTTATLEKSGNYYYPRVYVYCQGNNDAYQQRLGDWPFGTYYWDLKWNS